VKQFKKSARYQRAYAAFKATPVLQRVLIALAVITILALVGSAIT